MRGVSYGGDQGRLMVRARGENKGRERRGEGDREGRWGIGGVDDYGVRIEVGGSGFGSRAEVSKRREREEKRGGGGGFEQVGKGGGGAEEKKDQHEGGGG